MKNIYSRFRIMVMTFALGLAGVFTFNGSLKFSNDVYVNIPKTEIGDVIVVFPRCRFQMPSEGFIGEAIVRLESREGEQRIEKKFYKEPARLTECINNQNSSPK